MTTQRHRICAILLVFLTLALLPFSTAAQWLERPLRPLRPITRTRPPDSILVRFRPGLTLKGLRKLRNSAAGATLPAMKFRREIPKLGIQVFRLQNPQQMALAVNGFKRMPEVLYAEPAYRITLLAGDPNDSYFNRIDSEHALFPENEWLYQWSLHKVQAVAAWSVWPNTYYTSATKPTNAVKVAVIDTGIDTEHPDFINAGGSSTDALNGGQLDLTASRNMIDGGINPDPTDPTDDFGHGTHVAGIIGASTNNAIGIAAIGYNAQIMSLKVVDSSGDGDDADVIDAMVWAADHGALIINMSIGLNGGYTQGLQDAVNYCWLKNTLVVAAAGNDGVDYVRRYPAACNKVLAVAATTFANELTLPPYETHTSYSNIGLYIGISAPGGDATFWSGGEFGLIPELNTLVWSTTPTYPVYLTELGLVENTYGYLSGTSMASPHVVGLAALYAGYKGFTQSTPNAPQKIIRAIQRGADNIAGRGDGGWTPNLGHGRINALATMQETFGDDRGPEPPGCITGQVTYYGTPVQNGAITAIPVGGTRKYQASSKEDGTYRVANLPPGDYNVSCKYFAILKNKTITVETGCDTMGTDFEMDATGVTVTVTPHTVNVPLGGSQQFVATVTGASNTAVLWSVLDGPGTITSDGIYIAPANTTTPKTVEIQATSLADPAKFDIAEVTITTSPASVTFQLNPIRGGNLVTATVNLSGPAPSGGALVALSSSKTALATVPANVTVPASATSANFTVTTQGVSTAGFVDVTATYGGGSATGRLDILPAVPKTITYLPTQVRGGNPTTATLTLDGKAPSDGLVVVLGSENTALATVPANVTVPAGTSTATFQVTTYGTSTIMLAYITAQANGVKIRVPLVVNPPAPQSLTFNPNPVRGNNPSTATLTLNGKAPSGGTLVTLSSSNTAFATVPANVTVPAGESTATFPVTTFPVSGASFVDITAAYGGVSVKGRLNLWPIVPKTLTFLPMQVRGGNPTTATLTLDDKAPAGGLVVFLASENTALATVPANVTVPAGETTATFQVTTYGTSTIMLAYITAQANSVKIRYPFVVHPPAPSSISYSPNPVKGGNSTTATLTLNGKAPTGGFVVALASEDTSVATVPASVTVPAGTSTATFTVSTLPVTTTKSVVIRATASSVTIRVTLTVTP